MDLAEQIKNLSTNIEIRVNERMNLHTSFKVGGPAKLFVRPTSVEELAGLIALCKNAGEEFAVIGKGSNLLVNDAGFDGVIISLRENFKWNSTLDENNMQCPIQISDDEIIASAGASIIELATTARDNELSGLEFACGIPGTLGGAIYMNAGAYGGEMKDIVTEVYAIDISSKNLLKTLTNEEMKFRYRGSLASDTELFIVGAKLKLSHSKKEDIIKQMESNLKARREKQPLEFASAGSTFKRPKDLIAAKLIDDAGLKGYRVGNAAVSEKHAGFVVNLGGATAADIYSVCNHVKEVVLEKFNVELELEIRTLGF